MQPCDENESVYVCSAIESGKPAFVRYPRGNGVGELADKPVKFEIGKAQVLENGNLGVIWAVGDFVHVALKINQRFMDQYGESFTVVNGRFIKPFDTELLEE